LNSRSAGKLSTAPNPTPLPPRTGLSPPSPPRHLSRRRRDLSSADLRARRMDGADPLCVVSSATCLLRRTLGGPAPAASPSKADEALLRGISGTLKGSKELVEQAKMAVKEHGDTRMVYQDDGAKAVAAANCKNNQLGRRRPAGERKQYRFNMKVDARQASFLFYVVALISSSSISVNKPVPTVDRSKLSTIADPDEYFDAVARLDEAERAIKLLKGEVQPEKTLNFEPYIERQRRNTSQPRKSYFFSSAHDANVTNIPASQSGNMTESQISQDATHASVSERNEQSVPSRANECDISDNLAKEDSFAEKDKSDQITNIMASFQNFKGPDKLDFLRKTIGIGEIRMEKIYHRDSVVGDKPLRSAARTNTSEVRSQERLLPEIYQARVSELAKHIFSDETMDKHSDLSKDDEFEGCTLESPLPGSDQARISELAEHTFRDAVTDKEDDQFEGSPDIAMGEQSLAHDSSEREKDREIPSPCVKSAEHVLDPEPNMPDCATIVDDPCSRHDIITEEDNVPMDYSAIDKSNNETVISSHHLEDASTEVLANTPGRSVASDDIARASHAAEDNTEHQASEIVKEDGVTQDKSVHSLEIPLEDIGPQNQSQVPDGAITKLTADLSNALSSTKLIKQKARKAAQRTKNKQQPKRGKKVADESSHSLEIPQAHFDSESQPHTHDTNTEVEFFDHSYDLVSQQTVMRNAVSPNKPMGQKENQRRNKPGKLNKRKSLADAGLEWQSGVRRSTRIRHRPLEHWRGERFVYGRIHDTMVTVIGVKSYSPAQDGKRALKVKSFVPEQYSDVVAQGAKY
ncbi:hypothetical protein EJB05_17849, partial [Eragrostis curvula]